MARIGAASLALISGAHRSAAAQRKRRRRQRVVIGIIISASAHRGWRM